MRIECATRKSAFYEHVSPGSKRQT